jgi:hypothetical protein
MGDCIVRWEYMGELKIGVFILEELFVEEAVRKLVAGVSYSSNSNVECSGILSFMSWRESSLLECWLYSFTKRTNEDATTYCKKVRIQMQRKN